MTEAKPMQIQWNLNSSNTDGSFIMANSDSFLSPNEILPLAQENKYLGKFSYFIMKLYVVCTDWWGDSNEYTQHTIIVKEIIEIPELSLFASWPGTMINPQWLEVPMSRTIFYGPKDVRAIEVRLYVKTWYKAVVNFCYRLI